MTLLKQQISLIPFLIEPYKRWRFENRPDQTFCILLIKDVLSVIWSANLRQRQNLKQKWSGIRIRIFGLIWIRMFVLSIPKLWMHYLVASVISPSIVQIGCWLYENWENREMLPAKFGRRPFPWLSGRTFLTGKFLLSCARPAADGWPLMWVNHLL